MDRTFRTVNGSVSLKSNIAIKGNPQGWASWIVNYGSSVMSVAESIAFPFANACSLFITVDMILLYGVIVFNQKPSIHLGINAACNVLMG